MGVLFINRNSKSLDARKYQKIKRLLLLLLMGGSLNNCVSTSNYYILFDITQAALYVAQHAVTQFW